MAIKAPFLPPSRLQAIADEFLSRYHPSGELPIPSEEIVEFRFQIDIVPMPGLMDAFDVDAFITSDLTEIRVDSFIYRKRHARYRFSLAHEVAHHVIHQDIFKALEFSTIGEWKKAITSIDPEEYGWIEWQGYCLAGLILVPTRPLREIFEDCAEKARAAGIDLRELDPAMRKSVQANIGKQFEVSAEVIAKRLKAEKLWGD